MEVVFNDNQYLSDIDVLCRVYKNQSEDHPEEEQIVSEVLFKPHMDRDHKRALCWLPRGAVAHIVEILNEIDVPCKVQISNELDDIIGVLTSCRENFSEAREWEHLKTKLC